MRRRLAAGLLAVLFLAAGAWAAWSLRDDLQATASATLPGRSGFAFTSLAPRVAYFGDEVEARFSARLPAAVDVERGELLVDFAPFQELERSRSLTRHGKLQFLDYRFLLLCVQARCLPEPGQGAGRGHVWPQAVFYYPRLRGAGVASLGADWPQPFVVSRLALARSAGEIDTAPLEVPDIEHGMRREATLVRPAQAAAAACALLGCALLGCALARRRTRPLEPAAPPSALASAGEQAAAIRTLLLASESDELAAALDRLALSLRREGRLRQAEAVSELAWGRPRQATAELRALLEELAQDASGGSP
jgi:hypothetical protein